MTAEPTLELDSLHKYQQNGGVVPPWFNGLSPEQKGVINTIVEQASAKLSGSGVRIELVEHLGGLAMMDHGENVLRIRQDATPEFVTEYIDNAVLGDHGPQQEPRSDVLQTSTQDMTPPVPSVAQPEKESTNRVVAPEELKTRQEEIEGILVHTTADALKNESADDIANTRAEIDGALLELKPDPTDLQDEGILDVLKKSGFTLVIKGREVSFPVYDKKSKILSVGIHNTGEEIILAIRNKVLPHLIPSNQQPVNPDNNQNSKSSETTPKNTNESVHDKFVIEGHTYVKGDKVALPDSDGKRKVWVVSHYEMSPGQTEDRGFVHLYLDADPQVIRVMLPGEFTHDLAPTQAELHDRQDKTSQETQDSKQAMSEEESQKKPAQPEDDKTAPIIEEVLPAEAQSVLRLTYVNGDEFNGVKLTTEILQHTGLQPKYRCKDENNSDWYVSEPYDVGEGRTAVVAYVKKARTYVARSFYQSNSQGIWRYMPDYLSIDGHIDWYGKGFNESSITLPIETQRTLAKITAQDAAVTVQDPELIFAGTARSLSNSPGKGTFYVQVESQPLRLDGNFYPPKSASGRTEKIAPEQMILKHEESPDFTQLLTEWSESTDLYASIHVEVYPSHDGRLKYMFCSDSSGRVWIGGIEDGSKLQSVGLRQNWVDGGDLTTPAYEYNSQAGEYGNYNMTRQDYVDMYQNYLSRIPVIAEYVHFKKTGEIAQKPEVVGKTIVPPPVSPPLPTRTQEEQTPKLSEQELYEKLEELRNVAIQASVQYEKAPDDNDLWQDVIRARTDYERHIDHLALSIKNRVRTEYGVNDPLTPEQMGQISVEADEIIFDQLIVNERRKYKEVYKQIRGEKIGDKILEKGKELLGTRAVQWYLNLSPKKRKALNFAAGGLVGIAAGAVVAPGMFGLASYIMWRGARFVVSGYAGKSAGEWANKRWSPEELQAEQARQMKLLEQEDLTMKEKAARYGELDTEQKKSRIFNAAKRIGVAAGAGAGAGFLSGLVEGAVMGQGLGGRIRSAVESKGGGRGDALQGNRISPRTGYRPDLDKSARTPTPSVTLPTETPQGPNVHDNDTPPVVEPPPAAETVFADPSVAQHEVQSGDSVWGLLKKTLDNEPHFKGFAGTPEEIEAKQTYVLSALTNKILSGDPGQYNISPEGHIKIGDKVNFTNLFSSQHKTEFNQILEKADKISSPQIKSIIDNNSKIEDWIKNNPNEPLTNNRVSEILSGKVDQASITPPVEPPQEAIAPPKPETPDVSESQQEALDEIDRYRTEKAEHFRKLAEEIQNAKTPEDIERAKEALLEFQEEYYKHFDDLQKPLTPKVIPENLNVGSTGLATVAVGSMFAGSNALDRAKAKDELAAAKARLAVLEGGKPKQEVAMEAPKTFRTFTEDAQYTQELNEAYEKDIDQIYGYSRILLPRITGIRSSEWGFMRGLPAKQVIEFFTEDSRKSLLPANVIELLTKDETRGKHKQFVDNVLKLMNEAGGNVKPFEKESVDQFFKRLGGYVYKQHKQKQSKAA